MIKLNRPLIEHRWEYAVPILATLSLLVCCVFVSSKKYFWIDELLSYYLLSDPSFRHMLVAFHDKINSAPPLYFILGWAWAHVFGPSELSLRLLSCLGVCVGLWLTWVTLRRTFGFWPASVGAMSVFCTLRIVLAQNVEARMYGLFLGLCALGLFLYERACRKSRCSWSLIVGTVCTHAAIINTHLFGAFYSGALLVSIVVRDRCLRIFRPKLYLAIVLSWISLAPYIPSFLNQSKAVNSRAWLPAPILNDLIEFVSFSSYQVNLSALALLILIAGLQLIWRDVDGDRLVDSPNEPKEALNSRFSLVISAYAFLAIPAFIWVLSRIAKPMFYDRYMLPTALSWSILMAYVASRMVNYHVSSARVNSLRHRLLTKINTFCVPLFFILFLLGQPLIYARAYTRESIPGLNDKKFGYTELPIVVQHSHEFLKRLHYSPARDRYFFVLDWQAAVDKASGLFGPQEYQELEAVKRSYPELGKHIVNGDAFLSAHDTFLVIDSLQFDKECPCKVTGVYTAWDDIDCPQWVEKRLLHNPHYKVESLGQIEGETILLVNRH